MRTIDTMNLSVAFAAFSLVNTQPTKIRAHFFKITSKSHEILFNYYDTEALTIREIITKIYEAAVSKLRSTARFCKSVRSSFKLWSERPMHFMQELKYHQNMDQYSVICGSSLTKPILKKHH